MGWKQTNTHKKNQQLHEHNILQLLFIMSYASVCVRMFFSYISFLIVLYYMCERFFIIIFISYLNIHFACCLANTCCRRAHACFCFLIYRCGAVAAASRMCFATTMIRLRIV